jgi:hypothetical protein
VRPPARPELIPATVSLKDGVDEAFEGNGVLYFKRLTSRKSKSFAQTDSQYCVRQYDHPKTGRQRLSCAGSVLANRQLHLGKMNDPVATCFPYRLTLNR